MLLMTDKSNGIYKYTALALYGWIKRTDRYLFGGTGGGQVFFYLLPPRLTDVVVCRILKVGLYLY